MYNMHLNLKNTNDSLLILIIMVTPLETIQYYTIKTHRNQAWKIFLNCHATYPKLYAQQKDCVVQQHIQITHFDNGCTLTHKYTTRTTGIALSDYKHGFTESYTKHQMYLTDDRFKLLQMLVDILCLAKLCFILHSQLRNFGVEPTFYLQESMP